MDVSADLETTGVAVQDDFLNAAQLSDLMECARRRLALGAFAAARVGGADMLRCEPEVRGDRICWLSEPLFAPEQWLLSRFEQLRLQLNRRLYLGLFELEAHYAWYPPGAGYERHVDQPRGSGDRLVSLILYLNEQWPERPGGELEIFDTRGGDLRIAPCGGRLVCFLSARREHAVHPSPRDRFSVAGWFRTRG